MAPAARGQAPAGRWIAWGQGISCGVLAALVPSLAVLLAVLLAPGLGALVLDRAPGRPIARAVMLFGLASSIGFARNVSMSGLDMGSAAGILADPLSLASAWTAGAAGWLVAEFAPLIAATVLDAKAAKRTQALTNARAALAEEWGLQGE